MLFGSVSETLRMMGIAICISFIIAGILMYIMYRWSKINSAEFIATYYRDPIKNKTMVYLDNESLYFIKNLKKIKLHFFKNSEFLDGLDLDKMDFKGIKKYKVKGNCLIIYPIKNENVNIKFLGKFSVKISSCFCGDNVVIASCNEKGITYNQDVYLKKYEGINFKSNTVIGIKLGDIDLFNISSLFKFNNIKKIIIDNRKKMVILDIQNKSSNIIILKNMKIKFKMINTGI